MIDVVSHIVPQKLILGLSGGIDSMVLADLLLKAKTDFVAAHCNFHLRGEESDGDEQFVREFAENNGLTLYVKHFDTVSYAKEHGVSIEMAARDLRYAWFEELRQQLGFDKIAVAHHADDQLETFFINLLRGAGIRGLKGMRPVNGSIIRPLLDVSRAEIHQYAMDNGIQWREDHTNGETQFLRNKIRHELLPVIDNISKEGRSAVLKSIGHLSSENELYRELLKKEMTQMVARDGKGQRLQLCTSQFSPLTSHLLFEWLRDYGFNSDQVHFIYEAMNGQPGTAFFSPTHRVTVERDGLELIPLCQQQDAHVELLYQRINKDEHFILDQSPQVAQLDYDKLIFPLKLRRWRAGDRFHPLGLKGSKLLSDFFVDQKMTTRQKEECLVLTTANDEIVWVVGRRIDDYYKVTDKTKTVLIVRMM
jgi:tRNA(Ile)-lysidine synthase